jgi:hypothetical protein
VRRRPKAARAATLVVALASMLLLAGPGVPQAAADSCDGVWVVVDARAAGGTITTRCAPGDPPTGLAALQSAGHDYTFVPPIPGMVCTIDARPDPCNNAPVDAYWSYWYAQAGGTWAYATTGAGTRDPAPGSVEGWRFGDGTAPPGIGPPATAAPAPTPEPDPEPPSNSTEAAPSAAERGDTAESGSPGPSSSTPSAAPAPPEAVDAAAPETSPAAAAPPQRDADRPVERQLLDPRTSPSLPRPDPAPTTRRSVDAALTDSPGEPGPEASPVSDSVEVGGASLAASASDDPAGPAPAGPALAVALLVGLGVLTRWQRRRRDGAVS